MISQALSFVDVETTGSRVNHDRIIEIGIVRVEKGKIKKKYKTLINPECYISPFIEDITGIKSHDLDGAPLFENVAQEIWDVLNDSIFVAHNVRFDYSFIRNEYRRLGIPISLQHFCSVRLSRLLYPEEHHHNLDSIIERFDIQCTNRHRAFDDANAVWSFFKKVHAVFPPSLIDGHIERLMKKPSLPRYLKDEDIELIPESPGVYIFYGENDMPLYIGKSVNMKERVLSHFSSDFTSTKEMNLSQQVQRIDTEETAGELGALLRETELVKKLQPLYNRQLRIKHELYFLKKEKNHDGYKTAYVEIAGSLNLDESENILGIFRSKKQVKDFLAGQVKKHLLCPRLLGLEKTKGPCFSSKLGICRGACTKSEKPIKYNLRFYEAFAKTKMKSWPFNGPVTIRETDMFNCRRDEFVVINWKIIEIRSLREENMEIKDVSSASFDLDTYRILTKYLTNPDNARYIQTMTDAAPRPEEDTTELFLSPESA